MNSLGNIGKIASLHLHSDEKNIKLRNSAEPFKLHVMKNVSTMKLIAGKGILNNTRYFNTINKITGNPNINHVSLIEREQISDHRDRLNMSEQIVPGMVRSNIETTDINLTALIDHYVSIGETAVVRFYRARSPCWKMDIIKDGLQKSMKCNQQGVIAEIIISGDIKIGDIIKLISKEELNNKYQNKNGQDD